VLLDEPERRLLAYAEQQTAAGAAIHWSDAATALQCRTRVVSKTLQRLVQAGRLLKLAGRDGWVATQPLAAALQGRRVTLSDLLAFARSRTTDDAVAHRGRRALHESHRIDALTRGQLADIERLVHLVLRHDASAAGDPTRIADARLAWDATANTGRGSWALCAQVRAWAEAEHRQKHAVRVLKRGQRATVWMPKDAMATVRDYQGAVNNLLNLAATAGIIRRSPLMAGSTSGALYAPTWVPVIARVVRWLGAHTDSGNPRRRHVGARCLAVAATRLGGWDLQSTDWLAVRRALEDARAEGTVPKTAFEAARYVWRGTVAALRARMRLGPEFNWPIAGEQRIALVSESAIRGAADVTASASSRDFSGWTTLDGRPATGLVEGPYGLRAFAAWSTVDSLSLFTHSPPLPPRAWASESSVAPVRRKGSVPLQVRETTLDVRVRCIARLAGYAARERGIDWQKRDLRALADPSFLSAYVAWTRALPADARGDRTSQLVDTIKTMAWVTNGFLAGQARLDGDAEECTTLRAWYHEAEALARLFPTPGHKNWHTTREAVLNIADAWRGYDGVDGLKKMARLVACLEAELIHTAGGRTLAEQMSAISRGEWVPPSSWCSTLRLIMVLVVGTLVPLRGRTFARLTTAMWKSAPVSEHQRRAAVDGGLPRWEGALSLDLPASVMKSKRPFKPALILPEHVTAGEVVGSAAHEASIRRDLMQLWFMPGGGRDGCRTVRDPITGARVLLDVDWVFPDSACGPHSRPASSGRSTTRITASSVAAKGPRPTGKVRSHAGLWIRASLSAAFKRAVLRHARELFLDANRLRATRGATGFHTVRRLFGTYWAPKHLVWTSRLLDHTSVEMTLRIYVAQDERTMSLNVGADV